LCGLKDRQQFQDDSGNAQRLGISSAQWPIFGMVWDSGLILAYLMSKYDFKDKRILEVGCGLALASHLLNQRKANITATDYHPEVEGFLLENTRINKGEKIPFTRTSWTDEISNLGQFDLIIGSDLIYERDHPNDLGNFICQHVSAHADVIIINPGRAHFNKFTRFMQSRGFTHSTQNAQEIMPEDHAESGGQINFYKK